MSRTPFSNSFARAAVLAAVERGDVIPDALPTSAITLKPFDPAQSVDAAGLGWGLADGAANDKLTDAENPLTKLLVRPQADWVPAKSREFLIGRGRDGKLPMGAVSILAGAGGGGKSALASLIGVQVAGGLPFAGSPTKPGCVLLVSFEDDSDECQRRIHATAEGLWGSGQVPPELFDRIGVLDLAGRGSLFTKRGAYGATEATLLGDMVADLCKAQEAEAKTPMSLIVVDHARLAQAGDPNESEAVSVFTSALSKMAKATGAAVLLLCHTPKSVRKTDKAEDYSAADVLGSGGYADNSRFVMLLTPMLVDEGKKYGLDGTRAKDYLALRVVKSNYSRSGSVQYLQRRVPPGWDCMVPIPADMGQIVPPPPPVRVGVHERIVQHVHDNPGRITRRRLRDMARVDGPLKASKSIVESALAELLDQGRLVLRPPTDAELVGTLLQRNVDVLAIPNSSGILE